MYRKKYKAVRTIVAQLAIFQKLQTEIENVLYSGARINTII